MNLRFPSKLNLLAALVCSLAIGSISGCGSTVVNNDAPQGMKIEDTANTVNTAK